MERQRIQASLKHNQTTTPLFLFSTLYSQLERIQTVNSVRFASVAGFNFDSAAIDRFCALDSFIMVLVPSFEISAKIKLRYLDTITVLVFVDSLGEVENEEVYSRLDCP